MPRDNPRSVSTDSRADPPAPVLVPVPPAGEPDLNHYGRLMLAVPRGPKLY